MSTYHRRAARRSDRRLLRFLVFGAGRRPRRSRHSPRASSISRSSTAASSRHRPRRNRTAQAIPVDSRPDLRPNGTPLVINVPSYAIKIRPADLPDTARRGRGPAGRPAEDRRRPTSTPRSTATRIAVRSRPGRAGRPDAKPRASSRRRPRAARVSGRRRDAAPVPRRPAHVAARRLHGTGQRRPSSQTSRTQGYLPDDLSARPASRPTYEDQLRGDVRERDRRARRRRAEGPGPPDDAAAGPGRLARRSRST